MADSDSTKLCECGCGKPAPISKLTRKQFGHVRGLPVRFISGHNHSNRKHGHSKRSSTYLCWQNMRRRCRDQSLPAWHRYGGRGITVCKRWRDSFENFLADMGERPDGTTLERDNANGDYKPGNCRWATMAEQGNNRSDNVVLEFQGRRMTISQWAAELGVKWSTIKNRVKRGWPIKRVLTERVGKYSRA